MTLPTKHNRVITVAGEVVKTILTLAIYAFIVGGVLWGLAVVSILGGEYLHHIVTTRVADR